MDFNYEGSGDELVFFMGDDAEAQTAYIEHDEGDSFTLLWENNLPEKMQFVSEGTLVKIMLLNRGEIWHNIA